MLALNGKLYFRGSGKRCHAGKGSASRFSMKDLDAVFITIPSFDLNAMPLIVASISLSLSGNILGNSTIVSSPSPMTTTSAYPFLTTYFQLIVAHGPPRRIIALGQACLQ